MAEDGVVYKRAGPVLLKQEKSEAVMAVDGRLEFIEKEMYVLSSLRKYARRLHECRKRIEKQISDIQSKSDGLRSQVCKQRW